MMIPQDNDKDEWTMFTDGLHTVITRPLSTYYWFPEGFGGSLIDRIMRDVAALPSERGTVSGVVDATYRSSTVKWLPRTSHFRYAYKEILELAAQANDRMWRLDLQGLGEKIQWTEYSAETGRGSEHYDWHTDSGDGTASKRKVSITVQLSDPEDYEGGELQFRTNRQETVAPKKKGAVVVFPATFLHRVTPVTKGTRHSLVTWVTGPPLR